MNSWKRLGTTGISLVKLVTFVRSDESRPAASGFAARRPSHQNRLVDSVQRNSCQLFGNFRKVGILSRTDSNFFNRLRLVFVLHCSQHELNAQI